jgi:hypothetical protein
MASFGYFYSIDYFMRVFPHYPFLSAVLHSIINLQGSGGQEFKLHIARHQTCP